MTHTWQFFRAGGVDQVSLRSGADILALPELDQKLWVALAMPTRDVHLDPRTLDLLDGDRDGRIRVPDILGAVKFVEATWKQPDKLLDGGDELPLTAIKDLALQAAAKRILTDLGLGHEQVITLANALDVVKAFSETTRNGDGVIIEATATDDEEKKTIAEAIACGGSVVDRSGKPGVDKAKLDAFFADADKLHAWRGEIDKDAGLRPLAEPAATAAAADALEAVRAKIEDYFARCRVAAFDPRALGGLNGQDADFASLGGKILSSTSEDVARLPLARVEAGRPLPLGDGINPAWAGPMAAFVRDAVTPVLGARTSLNAEDLATLVAKLEPFMAWRKRKPATVVDALPAERVATLATGDLRKRLAALVEADLALADEYKQFAAVEKMLRFQRDLALILRNFVNFADFYARKGGVFQTGTLYLDARGCQLCVAVSDAGKHAALAGMSAAHLVYCDLTRGAEKRQIAAAFTNGDTDYLIVGRNGVFYDREGRDWDATITKIISNPLSIRQAFWAPYKKLARMIEDQIAKRAAAADAASEAKITSAATAVANIDQTAKPPAAGVAPAAPPKKIDVGTVAAIGVAIGGVGAMIVGILATFTGLGAWMPFGVLALLLIISGPSMLLAYLKLRQRNLGPILDANGWALNGRARVNVAFGAALTDLAKLPRGAKRSFNDPYADKKRPWKLYIFLITLLVLAATWYVGKLDRWLPDFMRSTAVLGKHAPAAKHEVAPTPAPTPAPAPAPTPTPAPAPTP